jgi:hypothetical protein
MFGNMMDLHKPHSTIGATASGPCAKIETVTKIAAAMLKPANSLSAFIQVTSHEPTRRPTNMPNQ